MPLQNANSNQLINNWCGSNTKLNWLQRVSARATRADRMRTSNPVGTDPMMVISVYFYTMYLPYQLSLSVELTNKCSRQRLVNPLSESALKSSVCKQLQRKSALMKIPVIIETATRLACLSVTLVFANVWIKTSTWQSSGSNLASHYVVLDARRSLCTACCDDLRGLWLIISRLTIAQYIERT